MSFWEEEAIQFLLEEEKDDELLLAPVPAILSAMHNLVWYCLILCFISQNLCGKV